jgi:signal transduction histidine kinase
MNTPGAGVHNVRPVGGWAAIRIRTKLQIALLLVGVLSVAATGWISFENARPAIEKITFDRLTAFRETQKRQIESYFQQIADLALLLSTDPGVGHATRAFHTASVGNQLTGSIDEKKYLSLCSAFDPLFARSLQGHGIEDVLLIDAGTGKILYTLRRRDDAGTSLTTGPYRASGLARLFASFSTDSAPGCHFADFEIYTPSGSAPVAFAASPVMDEGRQIAILAFELPIEPVNRLMTSGARWKEEGLGETGETYIVGPDYRMRTDSRFFIQDPAAYCRRLARIGTDSAIIRTILARSTSILVQEVRTSASIEALQGVTDTKIITDYRGIPVLSSYTPLAVPPVHWVMLSEIDASEAFRSVYDLRERLILLGLFVLLVSGVVGLLLARAIARPILALAGSTQRIGEGDLRHRASVRPGGEIGVLAATLNTMAENILRKTEQLETEVADRRKAEEEVRKTGVRLRNLSAHLQTVREEERKGIAREIHDELGQVLTTLKLNLSVLKKELGPSHAADLRKVDDMLAMIDTTIRSVKRMITALRPRLLDDLGLTAAIEWQVEEFSERTGIRCTHSIRPPTIAVDSDKSTAIFRILQEALTNIARHSKAKEAEVSLVLRNGILECTISDNGIGIASSQIDDPRSFGLIGIRERASYWGGTVMISGEPGAGTTIEVRIPLNGTGEI